MENRRAAGFKFQGMTTEEMRRRREENQVEIRKAKREDSLNKRRNMVLPNEAASPAFGSSSLGTSESPMASVSSEESEQMQKMATMTLALNAPDYESHFKAVQWFRKLLSKEHNPPIDEVLKCNVLGRFVEILAGQNLPIVPGEAAQKQLEQVQFEAAWVLTNIASGTSEHTQTVVMSGAFHLFVQLLSHPNPELRGQCIWAIGNIAGEGHQYRDACLQNDVLSPLLQTLVEEMQSGFGNGDLAKNTTWALSNLCRGKPGPQWNQVAPALPVLAQLLYSPDEDLVGEAGWAIAYISDVSPEAVQAILDANLVPRCVQLLASRSSLIQASSVRIIGNILTGDELQTQMVIDAGALPALGRLLSSTSRSILRETCWAISNVTAGTADQIRAAIDANLIPPVVRLLSSDFFSIKREACWAVSNATSVVETHPEIIKYLVSQGCIKPLCDILKVKDLKIIQVALDGLDNILQAGDILAMEAPDHMNPYALHVEEAQGLDTIKGLQHHVNMVVYLKAKSLIDKYFSETDDDGPIVDAGFDFSDNMAVPQGGFDFS